MSNKEGVDYKYYTSHYMGGSKYLPPGHIRSNKPKCHQSIVATVENICLLMLSYLTLNCSTCLVLYF